MVVSREEGKLLHFLNGRLVAEDDFTEEEWGESYSSDWFVGGFPSLNKFSGFIDELRLYSKVLSDTEVSNIYNWGSGDMGVAGKIEAAFVTDENPIPISLKFYQFENLVEVEGLTFQELNDSVSGGSIDFSSFSPERLTHRLIPFRLFQIPTLLKLIFRYHRGLQFIWMNQR